MNFKKWLIVGSLLIGSNSFLNALDAVSVSKIDRIMNEGILINKKLKSDKKINLTLFKALTKESEAVAILRIKNLTDGFIKVSDYVDYGMPVKPRLAPSELTYILIEDSLQNANKRIKKALFVEDKLKQILKTDFSDIKQYISSSVNVYNLVQNKMEFDEFELNKVYITDFIDFMNTVKRLDYYSYLKTNIQNSLYHGYYFSGYELYKNGTAKPRSYYFITDEITNKISMIYIVNENMKYNDFKDIIMNKTK